MAYTIGIDTGGTFTDLVAYDASSRRLIQRKTLTNYANVMNGVLECLRDAGVPLSSADSIRHGTTHVINAYLQRRGARTALITTRGFRDALEIGRANRPTAFQLRLRRPPPLVPRRLRFEITERVDAHGNVLAPIDIADLEHVADALVRERVEAAAISFINAYQNPEHEHMAAQWLRQRLPQLYVTTGTELSREWFEYERTATAVANAFVGPGIEQYLDHLAQGLADEAFSGPLQLMASNGGTLSLQRAKAQPVALVESGPIGGCIGAAAFARGLGIDRMIAFDMGGTTAKCALIEHGGFDVQPTYFVGGYERGFPVRTAVLDIVEVGTGGGSIASVDAQGRLLIGPRSAGSEPGPVVFGRGGVEPTVTDANAHLGRIAPGTFLAGKIRFDVAAAAQALNTRVATPLGLSGGHAADRAACGILQLAATAMSGAIKEITVERGRDVRDYVLFVFGGGGPLHASTLARELHIETVIVPPQPGGFSAAGMLMADRREDVHRTFLSNIDDAAVARANELCAAMEAQAFNALQAQVAPSQAVSQRRIELRYKGQRHTLALDFDPAQGATSLRQTFDERYRERYGHADPASPAEIVALRVAVHVPTARLDIQQIGEHLDRESTNPVPLRPVYFPERDAWLNTPIFRRDQLPIGFRADGPAVIEEYGSTTVVGPLDTFEIGKLTEIRIQCTAQRND